MRFVTEFEVPEYFQSNRRIPYVPEKRHIMEVGMGNMIAESFGWQNPVNHNLDHHRLEIEAFRMDKWIDFKNRLLSHIHFCNDEDTPVDEIRVLQLIKELEFHDTKKESPR